MSALVDLAQQTNRVPLAINAGARDLSYLPAKIVEKSVRIQEVCANIYCRSTRIGCL